MHQYHCLCDYFVKPPLLGKPLDLCNSQELESITLNRIRSELNWHSPNAVPQLINIKSPFPHSLLYPVPGERWVLVYSQELPGCVYVYDIKAPMPQEPRPLIIPRDNLDKREFDGPQFSIDYDEPQLTFTVCLDQCRPDDPSSSWGTVIFYRVTQIGHGSNARLESTRLKSLLLPVTKTPLRSVIYGKYYARLHYATTTKPRIEIYDWLSSSLSGSVMTFLLVPPGRSRPVSYLHLTFFLVLTRFEAPLRNCGWQKTHCLLVSGNRAL